MVIIIGVYLFIVVLVAAANNIKKTHIKIPI